MQGSLSLVEQKAKNVTQAIRSESEAFHELQNMAKSCVTGTQSSEMLNRHAKY